MLTPKEQWDLHNFYLVTQQMTDAELRLHRRLVKRVDPSLPQRAGRAYAKLERGEWKRIDYVVTPKGRAIIIRTLVKPQPDLERYARAVLAVAMERHGLTPSWTRLASTHQSLSDSASGAPERKE